MLWLQRYETDFLTHTKICLPTSMCAGLFFLPCTHMWRLHTSSIWWDHSSNHSWNFTLGIAFSSVQPSTQGNLSLFYRGPLFFTNMATLSFLNPFFIQPIFNWTLTMCEELCPTKYVFRWNRYGPWHFGCYNIRERNNKQRVSQVK